MANGSESVRVRRGGTKQAPLMEGEADEAEESAALEASRPSAWERMLEELGGEVDGAGEGLEALHASIAERLRMSARGPGLERPREPLPPPRRRRR